MTKHQLLGASVAVLLLAAPVLAAPACALAEDIDKGTSVSELVATASRDGGVRRDLIGGSASVLTIDDLEQRGARVIGDVLRDIPGVEINRLGPAGTQTDIRIRGAEANQTLVLVDGINIIDPVGRQIDLSSMLVEDGSRIEVLRGQQSSLYGSEAIGGVIQYFTPDGRSSPGLRVRGEYGSFGTFSGALQYGGSSDKADYAITLSDYSTDGTAGTRDALRDLGFESQAASLKARYLFTDHLRLIGILRASRGDGDTNGANASSGAVLDNADHYDFHNLAGKIELQGEMLDGRWTHILGVQALRAARDGIYGSTPFVPAPAPFSGSFYDVGKRVKGSYVTAFSFGNDQIKQKLTGLIDYQHETLTADYDVATRTLNTTSVAGLYDLVINDRTAFGAAVRNDANNRFSAYTTYRVQATHRFDTGTRIRAAAGSGIKYPGQIEIFGYFGSYVGNQNLKPETSKGWEVGVEQAFGANILAGATYFDNALTNEIIDLGTKADNSPAKSHQKGVELFAEAQLTQAWKINASYTYLDGTTGSPPIQTTRRAKNIASLNLNWQALDAVRVNLNVRYNGEQFDTRYEYPSFTPHRELLPAYTLVGLNVDWKVNGKVTAYARADNLFDETYEEAWSYRGSGRELSVGLKARF